jgi:hypothetical protein
MRPTSFSNINGGINSTPITEVRLARSTSAAGLPTSRPRVSTSCGRKRPACSKLPRAYLGEEIEAQKKEAVRTSILNEVGAASSFWRQLSTALTYDHLAPLAGEVAKRLGPAATAPPVPSPR